MKFRWLQKDGSGHRYGPLRAVFWLLLSVGIAVCDWFFPIEGAYATQTGAVAPGWLNQGWCRFFPGLFALLVALGFAAWHRTGVLLFSGVDAPGPVRRLLGGLRPLAFLPWLVALRHASAWTGVTLAAMALPMGLPLLCALCLERLTRPLFEHRVQVGKAPSGWVVFLLALLSLFIIHHWQGKNRFIGGGDVCHYMVQTDNLVECGNLDLTNRVEQWMRDAGVAPDGEGEYIFHSHMRRNSKGRIYSVHGFGWPLLAWPFARLAGKTGILFLCMLLGAWGLTGVYAACLRCKATPAASLTATAIVGLSWFWNYTAFSRLPEMLGCALCIWAFWAFLAKGEPGRQAAATCVSALCCAYLPYAHMRFFPIATILFLAFLLPEAAQSPGGTRRRTPLAYRMAALIGVLLAWTLLVRAHGAMFEGVSSFSLSKIFMSRPMGILSMFVGRRGAGAIFPLIWLVALAPLAAFSQGDRSLRAAAVLALALEAATLVFCCANPGAFAGSCITARYFLQAIPALIPFGARYLDRCGRLGRRWWFFLAVIPVLYLCFISPICSRNGLVHSPFGLWDIDALRSFWMPFRNGADPLPLWQGAVCLVLPAALMTVPWLLARPSGNRLPGAAAVLLAMGLAAGLYATTFLPPIDPCPATAFGNSHGWHFFRHLSGPKAATFTENFLSQPTISDQSIFLTDHRPKDERAAGDSVYIQDIAPNDWAGRDFRWVLLKRITQKKQKKAPDGAVAIHVAGEVLRGRMLLSSVIKRWLLVPDDVVFEPGAFDFILLMPKMTEPVPIYAALSGNSGEARVDLIDVLPWAPGLDVALGPFPPGAIVVDALPEENRRRR